MWDRDETLPAARRRARARSTGEATEREEANVTAHTPTESWVAARVQEQRIEYNGGSKLRLHVECVAEARQSRILELHPLLTEQPMPVAAGIQAQIPIGATIERCP